MGTTATLPAMVLLYLARTLPLLILGRILQGIGSAVVWVIAPAIIADCSSYSGVAKAMGCIGVAMNIGKISGSHIGGSLYQSAGYDTAYGLAFGILILDCLLRLLALASRKRVRALKETSSSIVNDHCKPTDAIKCECHTTLFEYRHTARTTIIRLLGFRRTWGIILTCFTVSMLHTAMATALPLLLYHELHWEPLSVGLALILMASASLAGFHIGKLTDRLDPAWMSALELVASILDLVLLRLASLDCSAGIMIFLLLHLSFTFTMVTTAANVNAARAVGNSITMMHMGLSQRLRMTTAKHSALSTWRPPWVELLVSLLPILGIITMAGIF